MNKILTLCGPCSNYERFDVVEKELSHKGNIILKPIHIENDVTIDLGLMKKLKYLHFKKILISDMVIVVANYGGHIGDDTSEEIEFTKDNNKPVYYWDWYSNNNRDNVRNYPMCDTLDFLKKLASKNGGNIL